MATKLRTVVIVMSLALLMVVPCSSVARANPPLVSRPTALPVGDQVFNYTTPDESDVKDVAISPNGNYIAASTNTKDVYEFTSAAGSGGAISPSVTLPLSYNVVTMALSDTSFGGNSLLVMGVGPTLSVYNVTSSSIYWNYTFTSPPGTKATVSSVAISSDGTAIAAIASIPGSGNANPFYCFVYFKDGTLENTWDSVVYANPVDVSMDVDGTRVLVGETIASSAIVELFDPPTGSPTAWSPASYVGPSYYLANAQISGDGSSMYEISQQGFAAASVAHPGTTTADEHISSATMMSVSYTGCQILIGMGDSASYYDVSGQGASSCANASYAQPMWSGTFQSSIYSLSLAVNNPSYFVVAWGNELQWFYAYPGMPFGTGIAYRTAMTTGGVDTAALSATGSVVAVGSAFQVGGGDEFMLGEDTGVPTPAAPDVTATQVQGNPGDSTARETLSWSAPSPLSFTQMNITITTSVAGSLIPILHPITSSSPPSYVVTGLSFSTIYTVTVTLVAYGGAVRATSGQVTFTTAGAPPVLDPFGPFEYASIALIIAAIIVYVLLARKLPKHEEHHQSATPPSTPQPYYRPPPASPPPQQGET
jgi:hypothetical protein